MGVALEGAEPKPGEVLIAATDQHLILRTPRPPAGAHRGANPYRPSVDTFFESLARFWPRPGVGVLLTGMGNDGGRGMLQLRKAGWFTIAQDQATSVVYGMPKAAVELQAASRILPIKEIAAEILRAICPK